MRRWWFVALVALVGCKDFEPVVVGYCGNGVVEPYADEYCDVIRLEDPERDADGPKCGAAGTAFACQFVCTEVGDTCPPRWACGRDGICRAPSGQFDLLTTAAIPGAQIRVADVDGDGYDDVLGAASIELTIGYGASFAPLLRLTTARVAQVDSEVSLIDLDADRRADVVVPSTLGVQMFRGTPSHRVTPVAVPFAEAPAPRTRVFSVRAGNALDQPVVLLAYDEGGLGFSVLGRETQNATVTISGSLLEELSVVSFDPTRSTQELAVAGLGDRRVHVIGVRCENDEPCDVTVVQSVDIEGRTAGPGGTWVADVDGDGDTELLVTVNTMNPMTQMPDVGLAVAERTPDGRFGPLRMRPELGRAARCTGCGAAIRDEAALVKVVDLDGDGRADFVNRTGVYFGTDMGVVRPQDVVDRPWRALTVADFNDDGLIDIAATQPTAVDILLATEPRRFNVLPAPTVVGAAHVVAGDFDGDLRPDLAFIEGRETVSILFGGRQGFPSERVVMVEAPDIASITRARLEGDDIDDLVATMSQRDGPDLLFRLRGNGTRSMPSVIEKNGSVLTAVVAGRFIEREAGTSTIAAPLDVVTLEPERGDGPGAPVARKARVYSWSGAFGASIMTERELGEPDDCQLPAGGFLQAAAADLDGDGLDELIVQKVWGPDIQALAGQNYAFGVYGLGGDGLECRQSLMLPADVAPTMMRVGDFDQDGALDVAVALDTGAMTAGVARPMGLSSEVAIRWGDGEGGFVAQVDRVAVGAPSVAPFGIGVANVDIDAADEITFVDDVGVHYVDFEGRTGVVKDAYAGPAGRAGRSSLGYRSVEAGDVDGDGLQDLVVSTSEEVFLYKGVACSARDTETDICRIDR
ncbi:MAG: VCBS repeat-containing protein [Deltaproteobacteria bacterium]